LSRFGSKIFLLFKQETLYAWRSIRKPDEVFILQLHVRYKLWLESDDALMGEGLWQLLVEIERGGSISEAARRLKMSYRQAWGRLKKAEDRLGLRLLEKQVGGEAGGGATLTPQARELVLKFTAFEDEAGQAIENAFRKYFLE